MLIDIYRSAPRVREALRGAHPLVAARPRRLLVFGLLGNRVVGRGTSPPASSPDESRQHRPSACNTYKEGTCEVHQAAWLAVPLAGFLLLAACGDDSGSSSATTAGVRLRPRWRGGHHRRRRGDNGRSRRRRRDIARQRLPGDRRHPDRLEPRGRARRAVQAARRRLHGRHGKKLVTGPLMASGGVDTGVKIEIRSGGPAIGFQQVTVADVHRRRDLARLRLAPTRRPALGDSSRRSSLIASAQEEPADHHVGPGDLPRREDDRGPRPRTRAPLLRRRALHGLPGGKGIVQQSQVDGSLRRHPGRSSPPDGKVAQQGFASAEPYIYENEVPEWGKPVAFQLIHDAG